nr:hypothetical protein B0A51_04831 [Rachicladosporium sp. CCFEE 5018]
MEALQINLSLRMHALPLELFALIEDLVLDPDDTGNPRVISVDNVWCPPPVHQLNTATRRTHTAPYYATHIFDFSGQADTTAGVGLCARWLKHLPRSSQAKIRHIRFAASYDLPPSPPLNCSNLWNRILQCPNEKSVRLDLNVFEPVTCRRLVDWTSRQAVEIGLLLTEESLSPSSGRTGLGYGTRPSVRRRRCCGVERMGW